METLLKKRWFKPAVAVVAVVVVAVLVYAFFFGQTYDSIKDCGANPPFEGVYWGMTKAEFCKAMNIEESDLVEAAPLQREDWYLDVDELEKHGGKTAEELPLYEWETNNYYLALNEPIFGCSDYYIEDKPLTVRVIFTEETTYKGKTVPPLLRAILFQFPYDELETVGNEANLYYYDEELKSSTDFGGIYGYLNPQTKHDKAYWLSVVYSQGEVVETEEQWKNMPKGFDGYVAVRSLEPEIDFKQRVIHLGSISEWDRESIYVKMDAGHMAYYEYFLHELT